MLRRCSATKRAKPIPYVKKNNNVHQLTFDTVVAFARQQLQMSPKTSSLKVYSYLT